jgi:hypothetical protein
MFPGPLPSSGIRILYVAARFPKITIENFAARYCSSPIMRLSSWAMRESS